MSSRECLQRFSPNLFWDANPSELKMDESRGYIIQRVLEYGQMNDWKLINLYYGLNLIVEECKKLRTLNPVCLAFICTISHTKEEEYRCYYSTGNQGCLEWDISQIKVFGLTLHNRNKLD